MHLFSRIEGCSASRRGGKIVSRRHPIISVTGLSGAVTTSVKRTFEQIFHREGVKAVYIEGDAFHRYEPCQDARADGQRGGNRQQAFQPSQPAA
ncbi:hypothetical protein [Bradyrhizobium ivorense]|uniref:hypothetical protein n=1 Tax=Bradyrhizobium ivorense TaxID=2511166 RepID=UPI0035588439